MRSTRNKTRVTTPASNRRFTNATAVRVLPVPVAISTAHRAFGNAAALLVQVPSVAQPALCASNSQFSR